MKIVSSPPDIPVGFHGSVDVGIAKEFTDKSDETMLALAALVGLRFRYSAGSSEWCWIVDEHNHTIYYRANGKMVTFAGITAASVAREWFTAALKGELGDEVRDTTDFLNAARARVAGATPCKP